MSDTESVVKLSSYVFDGLQITPEILRFPNAFEGKSYKEKITLQNISNKVLDVTTEFPMSYSFRIDKQLKHVKLCPGLAEVLWVSYTYKRSAPMITARLTIYVNYKKTDVHFEVTVSKGIITCEPQVLDFGMINKDYGMHTQILTLKNKGRKQTKFEFDIPPNNLGLVISPKKGFIPGKTSIAVQIGIIGFEEGSFVKDVWIKCTSPIRFSVCVEVIQPKMIISSLRDFPESFLPIMFPPVYGGCRSIRTIDIFNFNTQEATYIILPELNFKIMTVHKIEQLNPDFKKVDFVPTDGILSPFGTKQLKIIFKPQMTKSNNVEKVCFTCFRLIKVGTQTADAARGEQKVKVEQRAKCLDESVDEENSLTQRRIKSLENISISSCTIYSGNTRGFENFIRLCIYGKINSVQVKAEPELFDINEILMNTQIERSLILRNTSKMLSINFKYIKTGYINVYPSEGKIHSLCSIELQVVFAPTGSGTLDKPIRFQLLYPSQVQNEGEPKLVEVSSIDIPVCIPVKLQKKLPQPKFNPGITPKVGHEVGFLTQDVTFGSNVKKPRQAVLQCCQIKPNKSLADAKIAFPNDRPGSLRPARELNCKTIFAKIPRVINLHDEYTLSDSELYRKQKNNSYYVQYIRQNQNKHILKLTEDYLTNEDKLLGNFKKLTCLHYAQNIQSKSMEKFPRLEARNKFFIHIYPQRINLKKVIVNTTKSYTIRVVNENDFPVHVLLEPFTGHKNILPNLPETYMVKAGSVIRITKKFCPDTLGTFNSVINAFLNFDHLIPILFQAEIVVPVVTLDSEYVIFDDKNPTYTRIIPLRNTLNEEIKFTWNLPTNSCFEVNPVTGTISSDRYINCELCYTPSYVKRHNLQVSISCEDGGTVSLNINACITKSSIEILENEIQFTNIPLNITKVKKNILRNRGDEMVLFKIRNSHPLEGIKIEPKSGLIRGKSDVELIITVLMKDFITFNCKIEIDIRYGKMLKFTITGNIDFPKIVIKQNENEKLRRIPAGALDISPFYVENLANSEVKLSFPKALYPEITISTSNKINISRDSNEEVILEKEQSIQLFIHFHPLDVCMNQFYLPIVLNDILGPPLKTSHKSLNPNTYLGTIPIDETAVKRVIYKEKLPTLLVSIISTRHIFRFSKTSFKFRYVIENETASVTSTEIKVKNSRKTTEEFCVGINHTYPHFDVHCKQEECITFQDNNVKVFTVGGEEEVTLIIKYFPSSPGTFSCQCPIIVKGVLDDGVFNYLQLKAAYPAPQFHCPRWIFLEPVPVNTMLIYTVYLTLMYHSSNCDLKIECDLEQLSFELSRDPSINFDANSRKMILKLIFQSYNTVVAVKKIIITCTCNAEFFIIVGACAAEDIVTVYAHYCPETPYIMESRGFPYFPAEDDMSTFAVYMRKCVNITERWLFNQIFKMSNYYYIPESMSGYYRYPKHSTKEPTLVLLQIFDDLIGEDIFSCEMCEKCLNDIERVNKEYSILQNILMSLNDHGKYLPYLRSRYLLSYDDYIIYMTKVRPMKGKEAEEPKSKELFLRRAKLNWLEMILNIFKKFILNRIVVKKRRPSKRSMRLSRFSMATGVTFRVSPEQQLLNWLDFIFHLEKKMLQKLVSVKYKNVNFTDRNVTNFSSDLSDGLVFIAVTIHFCPYLNEMFQDIYLDANSKEKSFHNAVLLIEAWKVIKFSFKINPSEIVDPLPLQMVFLVTYIHEVFESLKPTEEIRFSVGLSLSQTKEITIRNPNYNTDICMEICFINNKLNCFQALTQSNFIKIGAGNSIELDIQFTAKKRKDQTCTLLLCGDTEGQPYCKSIVYTLVGESHLLGEHIKLYIEMDLYKSSYQELPIRSPYPVAATYTMLFGRGCSNKLTRFDKVMCFTEYMSTIRPRTIYSKESAFVTDELGNGLLKIYLYCLTTVTIDNVLIMNNEEVGDFFISIRVQPINFHLIEKHIIKLELPENWDELECTCSDIKNKFLTIKNCPKRFLVNIPSKNDQFWNIIIESIMQCVPESEEIVWRKYLDSEMGPHILVWLLFESYQRTIIQNVLLQDKVYKVINNNSETIKLPKTVNITNIRSPDNVQIPIHITGNINVSNSFEFSLQSFDEDEVRWYQFEFIINGKKLINEPKTVRNKLRPKGSYT